MVVIRLSRFGKRKQAFYRIVVADSRTSVKGKYIEKIGHFNPLMKTGGLFIDEEKIKKWLKNGAKPSLTVYNLLVEKGIIKGKKLITKRKKQKKQKKEAKETAPTKPVGKEEEQKEEKPSSEINEGRSASQDKESKE